MVKKGASNEEIPCNDEIYSIFLIPPIICYKKRRHVDINFLYNRFYYN